MGRLACAVPVVLESVEGACRALASVESRGRAAFSASDDEEELPPDMAEGLVRARAASLMEEAGGRCREEPANEGSETHREIRCIVVVDDERRWTRAGPFSNYVSG